MRVAAIVVMAVMASAHADTLEATEGSAIRETAHDVTIELKDGYALYTVRRTFVTNRKTPDEAVVDIDIPKGATANRLRILANGKWYDGELLESREALRKYKRLTGYGAAPVQDPALLSWASDDELQLQCGGQTKAFFGRAAGNGLHVGPESSGMTPRARALSTTFARTKVLRSSSDR